MHDSLPDPDGDRMRLWAAGDRAAFEGIVRTWERPLGSFLVRLTGDADEASDLTQEVFFRVYLKGAKYREAGTFRTWLFQIALNLSRGAARKRTRKPSIPLAESHDPAGITPDHDDRERAELVAAALGELPGPLREVVVLRHYEALSFEAMARLLGTPSTTLKSRFAAAMTKLEYALTARGLKPESAP